MEKYESDNEKDQNKTMVALLKNKSIDICYYNYYYIIVLQGQ